VRIKKINKSGEKNMNSSDSTPIVCNLKEIRLKKNITQTQLADLVGVKRQAIYDMEIGRYLPNTSVAIRLARILDCNVEDIFYEISQDSQRVVLADTHETTGPRVNVIKVRDTLYAYSLSGQNAMMEEMKPADGLLEPGNQKVTLLKPNEKIENTALLMGCDPAFSILGHHVNKNHTDGELLCRFASSKKALDILAAGQTHIAGTHMHTKGSIDGNIDLARQSLKNINCLLVGFATFEEGLMVARGNPFDIRKPEDLARNKIRFVNREKGAALRALFDDWLIKSNIPFCAITGYHDTVMNHSQGAQKIIHGICDAALGLRIVAETFDLGFVPVSHVRCDLVIPQDLLNHMSVKIVLDTLQNKNFRHELNSLPGYDSVCTGEVISQF